MAITIQEALNQRIPRIRKPIWGNPEAYLRLPLFEDGTTGPWAELYEERSQLSLGITPGEQKICVVLQDVAAQGGYEIYEGEPSKYEQHEDNFARIYVET